MKLPKTVSIGGQKYKIKARNTSWKETEGAFGKTHHDDLLIEVVNKGPTEQILDTMIHEVFHGIWAHYHLEDKDEEERVVSTLSTGLVSVLRTNPEFVQFIFKALEELYNVDNKE